MTRQLARWLLVYVKALAKRLEAWAAPLWKIAPNGRFYFRGAELNPRRNMQRWSDVVKRDPCPYCFKPSDTEDHVIPKSKGGANDASNIVGACKACNHAKGDQPLLQYLLVRRRTRFTRHVKSAQAKRNQQRRAAKHFGKPLAATLAEHVVLTQMGGHA